MSKMFPGFDGEHFRSLVRHIQSRFDDIAAAQQELDLLIPTSPLRWIREFGQGPGTAHELAFGVIAPDDSSFQWSPMGSGLSSDLSATAEAIYKRMVERYDEPQKVSSR